MKQRIAQIAEKLNCPIQKNVPLKNLTTFKTGGNAEMIVKISSENTLAEIIREINNDNEKFFVLGKGSNIIADDNGYDGIIIMPGEEMSEITLSGKVITAGAGASLITVCRKALDNSLTGLEFAYGIPGSVGGAVYMNAGAYGGEIKDVIVSVRAADPVSGEIKTFTKNEMDMSYRHSIFSENKFIITEAVFELEIGEKNEIESKMNELMEKRRSKQPLEYPSAGSTFKRPEGSYASLLIEQCGLKGLSVGGAEVSTKHSGFIINKGNASSSDILTLIQKVQDEVFEKTGYKLETEPLILGGK